MNGIAWRILAAGPGAWAAAYALTAGLAVLLAPAIGRPDAVVTATLPAFLIQALLALRAFAVARPARAWIELAGLAALGGALAAPG